MQGSLSGVLSLSYTTHTACPSTWLHTPPPVRGTVFNPSSVQYMDVLHIIEFHCCGVEHRVDNS